MSEGLANFKILYVGAEVNSLLPDFDYLDSRNFDVDILMGCDAVVLQGRDSLDILRNIRRDSRVEIYLIPAFFDQGIRKEPEAEIQELADEWISGESADRFMLEHIPYIEAIRQNIIEYQEISGMDVARDMDMGLRTLRFHFTRKRPLTPLRQPQSRFGYSYPLIDANFPEDSYQKFSILDYLEGRHLIQGEFIDRTHLCSHCYSAHLNFREICTKCSSANLQQEDLVHHFACGNVAPEKEYGSLDDPRCPKCKKHLRNVGVDFDRPSIVYECNACEHSFQEPNVETMCFHCGKIMDPEDLFHHDIKSYRITSMGENSAMYGVILSLREVLKKELEVVDLETFRLVSSLEKNRIVRYKKSASSVGVLELQNVTEVFNRLGGGSVTAILGEISKAIKKTVRTSDLVSFLSDTTIILLFTETPDEGTRIVMNRLQDRIQEVLQQSVSMEMPIDIEYFAVDEKFSLDNLLSKHANNTST